MNVAGNIPGNDKSQAILDSALAVFLAYGFSRTTMDDIARAAKVSRPALYLHFANKKEIYRAIAGQIIEGSLDRARTGLEGDEPLEVRLFRAIDEGLLQILAEMAGSPHGAEIIDIKNDLANDLLDAWRNKMIELVASTIAGEAGRLGVHLDERGVSANSLAETLLYALEGMKDRIRDPAELAAATRRTVALVAHALRK